MTFKQTITAEMAKASPPVGVGALTIFGIPLSDWVLLLTAAYTILAMFFLLRDKWWRQRGRKD